MAMSRSVEFMDWELFRAFPLYLQFVVALMVVYAGAMTVLPVVAAGGSAQTAVMLSIAVFVWAFALVAVPTWLGPRYAPPAGE